jgi:hypothetical protein
MNGTGTPFELFELFFELASAEALGAKSEARV